MNSLMDFPSLVFVAALIGLWLSANLGAFIGQRVRPLNEEERDDFGIVQAAILTLLGLLIGFTFSMAISRYDQRKNLEEAEANTIGTEYVRADLLPATDAARVRDLLSSYLDQRVLFYRTRDERQLEPIKASTVQPQTELWAAVRAPATAQPTAITSLVASGMNDVLNSQGYTEAAWLNRIPAAAWILMAFIATGSNLTIGHGARKKDRLLFLVLPIAVALSFFLIADQACPNCESQNRG